MSSRFKYRALDARGKSVEGNMDAASAEEVGMWLTDRSYFVLEISQAPVMGLASGSRRSVHLSVREMNYFLMQLSSLINAGCPLLMSLQALHKQLPPGGLKNLLRDIKEKIETGKSFSEALKNHPQTFSNLFITMVEVGEVGGILDHVLERYSIMHDSLERIRGKLFRSMIYPALLLSMTLVVSISLLVFVFPTFIEKIQAGGGQLPLPTQLVMKISGLITGFFAILFSPTRLIPITPWITIPLYMILISAGVLAIWRKIAQNDDLRRYWGTFILSTPFLGQIFRQVELSLFARTLGTLLRCGVPILTSLGAVEKAHGNQTFKDAMGVIKSGVARGESVSIGMGRRQDLFPDSLILMTDVGERGGNIGDMLEKAAALYERDLETAIETAVTLVEPGLVLFLAGFVVLIALAMYLPLFDIMRVVR
ncbi:MAG: type II secretion system F family protein [Candidatus Riflebacteria bacterium]|nr:type II secretion system F family protein [Candidatus Riflebacteria bacterium]